MKRTRRTAFTMAEMLVVIAIILILASLLVPAVYLGLVAAQNAAIAVELGQLDSAMKQYKVLFKNYPPNYTDAATAKKHIQLSFGRYTGTPTPTILNPAETLVFWLQGYSDNPIDPLSGTRKSLMQFDPTRLKAGPNGGQMYFPANGQGQPYVYIHSGVNGAGYSATTSYYDGVAPGKGKAVAYKSNTTGNPWMNADTFQIISAGLDGDYGTNVVATPPIFPTAVGGNKDNITNFSGGTLASQVK